MGSQALVDTNILIDFLAGVRAAHRELARYDRLAISIVSRIELLAGIAEDEQDQVARFLAKFFQIELTPTIAQQTVQVRRDTRLKLPDAILLATAQVETYVLLTRNTKDFPAGPLVRFPYKL